MPNKRQDPLIYGQKYRLWREGEYLGIVTWTDDPNIGDAFLSEYEPGKFEVYMGDEWELVGPEDQSTAATSRTSQ